MARRSCRSRRGFEFWRSAVVISLFLYQREERDPFFSASFKLTKIINQLCFDMKKIFKHPVGFEITNATTPLSTGCICVYVVQQVTLHLYINLMIMFFQVHIFLYCAMAFICSLLSKSLAS